ncbi:MAG: 2-hydroxychromene-2-carboxylate isomerase [Proteobacteria bacterium]|nr:2-hydroxychromene-2-carboxylate isomerase [Pseudomonadota bacterium]
MPAPLRFHFDFISPYAYLCWGQIHALAERHGRTVEPVPVLFAALLNHWGHRGPAEIPPKKIYVFKDVVRVAARLDVPIAPPASHPFHPVLPLRVACVPLPADDKRRLVDALWHAVWGGGGGLDTPEAIASAIVRAGLEPNDILHAAVLPENKARLRAHTDAAVKAGMWGVPTIDADGELFWGLDSLPHLDAALRGEDPVTSEVIDAWKTVTSTAER